jgi:hypothetical protein
MRITLLLIFIFNSALSFSQQAELKFKDKVHRFGKVNEGVQLSYAYRFTNTGDTPLIFLKYDVACVCTVVDFPEAPVLPGENGLVLVQFDTSGKIAYQDREITIYSNAIKSPHKIRFTVNVNNHK